MATTRGTARRKRYEPEDIRAAFAPWFDGPETDDGEQRMYCPLCEEPGVSASASASMNIAENKWNCLKSSGDHGGTITSLVTTLRPTGFRMNAVPRTERTIKSVRAAQKAPQTPLEDQDKPMSWHDQLTERHADKLEWALSRRGIRAETLSRARVGFNGTHWTFPVRQRGDWLQVKFIKYNAKGNKDSFQTVGARAQLWPAAFLQDEPTLPVLLCEGEWDALLAEQESEGRYVAVTGTGGGAVPPVDLSMLSGREVFIAYDCDDTGKTGAQKVADKLREAGATAHIMDLTRLGLPFTKNHGADISDFFRKGGTADKLAAEFDRLRDNDPDEHDDVLRAIAELFNEHDDGRMSLIDEVRTLDDIANMPSARYVIEGWLPVGFFSDFFGEPGSKKTFALLDMLLHICAGMDWHGHEVTAGATLLFEGEGLEQLKARAEAWQEYYDHPDLAPFGAISEPLVMTTPKGVARVVRTVRDFEKAKGEPVVCVAFDPLVEYMDGEENGEGMEAVTRGLRALARYLDIAVVVGAHTNASGERARGGDHLRMRSGAHVRVESLKKGRTGLVQEKQKNGERLAMQFLPTPVVNSLVLSKFAKQSAAEYYASKFADDTEERAATKIKLSEETAAVKSSKGDDLLLTFVRENPGINKGKLVNACAGNGVGKTALEARVDALVKAGSLRFERDGEGPRAPMRFYLADPETSAEEVEQ